MRRFPSSQHFAGPWVRCVACFAFIALFAGVIIAAAWGATIPETKWTFGLLGGLALTALCRLCPSNKPSIVELACELIAVKLGFKNR